MRLKDKVVIVTGVSRNLGRVYALGLAAEGAKVAAADILDASDTVREIEGAGGEALYQDLTMKPLSEIPADEWDRVMAVNLRGTFLCCKAVVPHMKAQRYGRVVNIASNTVFKGTPGLIHYVTSKAGVLGFTRTLARECGEFGIHVNSLAPDYIPHAKDDRERPERDAMIQATRAIPRRELPQDLVGTLMN